MLRENSKIVNLAEPLAVEQGINLLATGDDSANRVSAVLKDGTSDVSLTGCTVNAYFARADGAVVEMEGDTDGSKAYIDLVEACYNVPGHFSLAIAVTGTNFATTVRVVTGTVVNTRSDVAAEGGTVYPSGAALMALLAAKLDAPASAGEAGDVLTSDGAGGVEWSAGGAPAALSIGGTVYTLRVGDSGAAGYLTFVLEE